MFQVQLAEIYLRKKHCKVARQQQETADHTVILVPGSFDVILLVDKQETAG
jgi:6,7-dimethyl-8-ribityllumazine synthase